MRIGRLYSCLASERAVPKNRLRRLMKVFSFWERNAGNRLVARGRRIGPNSWLMLLVAAVLQSRLSCVAPAALALAEFVGAYRPALQLLGLRAAVPKKSLRGLMKRSSFWERKAGHRPVARGKRIGRN